MSRALLPLLVLAGLLTHAEPLVNESFEESAKALKTAGWKLSPAAALVEGGKVGARCLRMTCPDKKAYTEFFIPVKQGSIYRARAWARCEGVARDPATTNYRGAAIFCQFADAQKEWRSGGAFPKGLFGTKDWQQLEVKYTAPIPEGVAYIQLMIGVEGTGTAWFDGIEVEEIAEWDTPKALAPEDGATVAAKRPLLQWEASLPKESYELALSSSPEFPTESTRKQLVWAGETRPETPLAPGVWHWRLRTVTSSRRLPATKTRSFTVPPDAADWPPCFAPKWTNDGAPQPRLSALLTPGTWVTEVTATIGGQPAVVKRAGDKLGITTTTPLVKGVHEVRIVARNGNGAEVTFEDLFTNKASATTISFRSDGIMQIDGKPFFPLGSYRDPSDTRTDFAGLKEAGFNVTHDYYFENTDRTVPEARAYLRAAHANGLRVFLGFGRPSIRRGDTRSWKRWTGELMDEPGLLTWYMMDEPICQGIPQAAFVQLQQAIRQMDSGHPPSLLLARISPVTEFQRSYAKTCDVLWCDPYPIPGKPLSLVLDKAEACREAAVPGRPFWVVLQGFDWRYWKERKTAFEKYGKEITRPTPEETRAMAHLALSTGAHGLIWYWSPNSVYHLQKQAPTVWKGICDTMAELNALEPYLTAPRTPDDDNVRLPVPFRSWSRAVDGTRVLAVVNASDDPAPLSLPARYKALDQRTGKPPADAPIPAWGTAIYTWQE